MSALVASSLLVVLRALCSFFAHESLFEFNAKRGEKSATFRGATREKEVWRRLGKKFLAKSLCPPCRFLAVGRALTRFRVRFHLRVFFPCAHVASRGADGPAGKRWIFADRAGHKSEQPHGDGGSV